MEFGGSPLFQDRKIRNRSELDAFEFFWQDGAVMDHHRLVPALVLVTMIILGSALKSPGQDSKRPRIYPFDVTLNGETAKVKGDPEYAVFAKVSQPVSSDAEMVLGVKPETVFVNIFQCSEEGVINKKNNSHAKIIMVPNTDRVKLNETMDGSVLAPGFYLMNIVLRNRGTSRVLFRVDSGGKAGENPPKKFIDQTKPEGVVSAIFEAAKSGDCAPLKALLPPSGNCDGDVKRICGVAEADPKSQSNFRSFFQKGKVDGKAKISADGKKAQVNFLFGADGTKTETMNLVKEGGKWYLASF